jgi:hypothetical protein
MNGVCACWGAYTGANCMMPVQCQEPCKQVCETLGLEDRCTSCIGMCESSAPKAATALGSPSLGVHNPFEDLQSTFLQENHTARRGHSRHPGSSGAASHARQTSAIAITVNSSGISSQEHNWRRGSESLGRELQAKHFDHQGSHHIPTQGKDRDHDERIA